MPVYTVTLSAEIAESLKAEGGGRLSKGIENIYRDWARGISAHGTTGQASGRGKIAKPAEPEHPYDPRNPTDDGRIRIRLAREDKEAKERAENHRAWVKDTLRSELVSYMNYDRLHDAIKAGTLTDMPDDWHKIENYFTWMELIEIQREHEVWEANRRARELQADLNTAETKRLRDAGLPDTRTGAKPVQTLKLTLVAMRRLGLLGTPEGLTDAQIAEMNAAYTEEAPGEEGDGWGIEGE